MTKKTCLLLSTASALALATTAPARADEAANTATARALGIEGVALANSGKCGDAIEKLARAEELHHAPTTATRLGECEIETGRLVAGTERLQRVVREPLAPNAHPAFAAAVARARTALEAALPRVPAVRITVAAPDEAKTSVAIDGETTPSAVLDTNFHVDPGTHTIEITAPGFLPSRETVTVAEGETKPVSLELARDPYADLDAPSRRDAGARDARAPVQTSRPSKVPAIVAFGVGAIGLGIGLGAGAVVARKASELEGACDPSRVCSSDRASSIEDARTWATVSTIGFVTAGVGAASGVLLLLLSKDGSARTTGARVRPTVGLGSVGLDGAF